MSTLIRRAAPGMALATVTLGAVWAFDPALHTAVEPTAGADDQVATSSSAATGGEGTSDQDGSTDSGTSADSGTAADPGGSTESGATCDSAETLTGDPAYTQWGPVQVELAVTPDGTICSADAVAYPAGDHHSARINGYAIPELNAMATSQGTSFQAISGATYTSEAYRDSMQSILDRL